MERARHGRRGAHPGGLRWGLVRKQKGDRAARRASQAFAGVALEAIGPPWRGAEARARAGESKGGGVRVGGDAGERRSGWKDGKSWQAGLAHQRVKG